MIEIFPGIVINLKVVYYILIDFVEKSDIKVSGILRYPPKLGTQAVVLFESQSSDFSKNPSF